MCVCTFCFCLKHKRGLIKTKPLANSQWYDLPHVVKDSCPCFVDVVLSCVRVPHQSVFFFCAFACPGCESGFCTTLPGCHRWSQQGIFSCVYESAMSWWTDWKCFGALNMKPWPWAQSVHYSLCSAANQWPFSDPGFLACFSSGFCLLFGFLSSYMVD